METNNKICLISNIGPHYRFPIFEAISNNFDCDFYFGNRVYLPIKTFDYYKLRGYKKTLKNLFFHSFYWQSKSLRIVFQKYDSFILDGEPYCLSSWVILLLCKLLGKQTIAWTHGWYGREGIMKKLLKKIYYSLHTKLMVYSEYSIKLMVEAGIPSDKLYCIANSMDSDKDLELRKTLTYSKVYKEHFGNSFPTIIYCGRIQKWKKLHIILDCMEQLIKKGEPVNVIFVGKDVDNVNLELLAKQKGIKKHIWLYGPCYDENTLAELFYNACVCVSPGNVGLTAIHALSFGCPVITHENFAYQNPEFEAIKPGITGDFFKQGDIDDLTKKISIWTKKSEDERNKIRQNAFNEIDRKWNIHYQLKIINEVINGK